MEHAEGSIVIEAPLEDVMEVIEDYESYPEWADVRTVDVRQLGIHLAQPVAMRGEGRVVDAPLQVGECGVAL